MILEQYLLQLLLAVLIAFVAVQIGLGPVVLAVFVLWVAFQIYKIVAALDVLMVLMFALVAFVVYMLFANCNCHRGREARWVQHIRRNRLNGPRFA